MEGASFVGNKISDLGNEVEEPYTLETKASDQFERIKSLFGLGSKKSWQKKISWKRYKTWR